MSSETQAASSGQERDSEDLARFGYSQELKRSLGLFSSFAVAFSYISPSTGIFTLFALGLTTLGGVFIWTWPVVALGQFIVALNFAEVSSHYPVAGSVFQWTKFLANRTYSWFTGWIYLFAGILTVTAVVATLPLALIPALNGLGWHSLDAASLNTNLVIALITLVVITVLNIYGVKLVSIINNTGVVFEILGMFVFALVLMAFHNHQGFSVVTNSAGIPVNGSTFLAAMFMSLFVIYGFDTASTLSEETKDPRRAAPKAVLYSVIGAFIIGGVFLLGTLVAIPNMGEAVKGAFGPAAIIEANFSTPFATIYLLVVSAAVFVCCLSIMAATIRLCFGMARDNQLPGSSFLADVELHRGGVYRGDPVLAVLRRRDHRDRRDGHDLPELLPRQHRDHAGADAGLAARVGAVQARPVGHAGQHRRPALRRGHAGQLRLAAGGQQPQAQPDRRAAAPELPGRGPDLVDRGDLHRAGRGDLLPDRRADQEVRAGRGAGRGRRAAGGIGSRAVGMTALPA
jgi:Amino acid permease